LPLRAQPPRPPRITIEGIRRRLIRWGGRNFRSFQWRKTRNHFHALLAELLLQRTRAEQVVPVFRTLARRFPTSSSLAAAPTRLVRRVLYPLGLRWRFNSIQALALRLSTRRGPPPDDVDELLALPGVGPYAAAAYRSMHLGARAPIVDSNVVRLYGRLFGFCTDGETRRKAWLHDLAERMTPQRAFQAYNYALLDFTRAICTPKPHCDICPLRKGCSYGSRRGVNAQTVR